MNKRSSRVCVLDYSCVCRVWNEANRAGYEQATKGYLTLRGCIWMVVRTCKSRMRLDDVAMVVEKQPRYTLVTLFLTDRVYNFSP